MKIIVGVLCLVLALGLGAVGLVTAGRDTQAVPAPAETAATIDNVLTVVSAAKDIKRGHRIAPDMLSSLRLADTRPAGAFDKPSDVVGGVTLEDIKAGQLILRTAVLRDATARPGLSVLVPPGKRAVALRVNDEVAVGNFVRPDDKVDIELVIPADQLAKLRGEDVRDAAAAESRILLQNIIVLSVGEALTVDQDNRAVRMQNLTVAVTPEEGLLLALAKQVGSFYLALRHPSDEHDVRHALTTSHDLLGNGAKRPSPRRSESDERPAPVPGRRVLVIQGGKETYQTVE